MSGLVEMKLELILTYWRDGLFRSRDRIESTNTDDLEVQFDLVMQNLKLKMAQEDSRRYAIADDDDIPF